MGIKGFFTSLINRKDSGKFSNSIAESDSKYLFVDYNSVVHDVAARIQTKLISLYMCKLIFDKLGSFDIEIINLVDSELLNLFTIEKTKESIDAFFENINEVDKAKVYVNSMVIKNSCDYILYLRTIYSKCIEIYIAIDGVPYKTKMTEQKKRRFIGELMQKMTKKFIDDVRNYTSYNELFAGEEEKMYFDLRQFDLDCIKFKFIKGNISPGTKFMDDLQTEILKIGENIVLDGCENPGEGERKIVERMNLHMSKPDYNTANKITVYSPDADVIILMSLENKKYDIHVHRYISQSEYKIIHIRNFCDFLVKEFFYKEGILLPGLEELDDDLILNDILILFSLLGNDFIPDVLVSSPTALYTINPGRDLNDIIKIYCAELTMPKYGEKYLARYDSEGKYASINWDLCAKIFLQINNQLVEKLTTVRPAGSGSRFFGNIKDSPYKKLKDYLNGTYETNIFIDISDKENNPLSKFMQKIEALKQYTADELKIEYNKLLFSNHTSSEQICEKYILGIDWVCKYYLNYNDSHNEWFYDTILPPTLFDLSKYIERNIAVLDRNINSELEKYITGVIMTPYHHLQYINYQDVFPLIDNSKLTATDRINICNSKKIVDWDKICDDKISNIMVCLFSRFLSQCDIMDEEKYERKSSLRSTAEDFVPSTKTGVKLPIPMLPSGVEESESKSMIGGLLKLQSEFNFKKLPIPMLQFGLYVNRKYNLNHHMDF